MSISKQQSTPTKLKRYFGQGSYGIIIGCPRLPSDTETQQEFIASELANNQVSKIIKDSDDIQKLKSILDLIKERFDSNNLVELRNQIVIPSEPQLINWHRLSESREEIAFLKSHKITKRRHKWHYLMERGTNDLDVELRNVSTLNELKHFLKGFANIINGVASLHNAGLVHTDIKLTNMIASWDGRYKLIDLDELGDATCIPANKCYFEKIYHNVYYPYYSPAGVFLWAFSYESKRYWDDKFINMLIRDLIKKNYDKDYYEYFTEISTLSLQIANDPVLTRITREPYENDRAMSKYLTDFKTKFETQPNITAAHQELLLFIDRYALGINLLILLHKYYKITGYSLSIPQPDSNITKCDFIPISLIAIIKLCCDPANYAAITTQQIADKYSDFIAELFRSYPYKFIIKLLSGLGIHKK